MTPPPIIPKRVELPEREAEACFAMLRDLGEPTVETHQTETSYVTRITWPVPRFVEVRFPPLPPLDEREEG